MRTLVYSVAHVVRRCFMVPLQQTRLTLQDAGDSDESHLLMLLLSAWLMHIDARGWWAGVLVRTVCRYWL